MSDSRLLGNIDSLFICLTVAMLWHSLQCWHTGMFIDKVGFRCSNAGGKITRVDLLFSALV